MSSPKNPETAAILTALTARAADALRTYLSDVHIEADEALDAYDAEMGEIHKAFDALLAGDHEGVVAHILAT